MLSSRPPLRDVAFWGLLTVVGLANIALVAPGLFLTRVWEDEAYNLTVPINLAAGAGYLSDGILAGGEPALFDVKISTGPVVLVPIAALVGLGLEPVMAGRLIMTVYAALLAVASYRLGALIGGRWAGIAGAGMVVLFDASQSVSPIQGPTDIIGEIPASALVLLALTLLGRRPFVSGVLLGLAIQCKALTILWLPALVLGAVLLASGRPAVRLRAAAVLGAGAALPTLAFEGVKLITLGFEDYKHATRLLRDFLLSGGQQGYQSPMGEKVSAALAAWSLPPLLVLVLLALVLLAATTVLIRMCTPGGREPGTAFPRWSSPAAAYPAVAALGFACWMGWWLASSSTPVWVRHPAPGLIVVSVVLVACAVLLLRVLVPTARRARRWVAPLAVGVLFVIWCGGALGHISSAYSSDVETLADQRRVADRLSTYPGEPVATPWGRTIPIAVLAGKRPVLPGEGTRQPELWLFPAESTTVTRPDKRYSVSSECAGSPEVAAGYVVCVARG